MWFSQAAPDLTGSWLGISLTRYHLDFRLNEIMLFFSQSFLSNLKPQSSSPKPLLESYMNHEQLL